MTKLVVCFSKYLHKLFDTELKKHSLIMIAIIFSSCAHRFYNTEDISHVCLMKVSKITLPDSVLFE